MKVYVVMSNDYPDSVFKSAESAELYVATRKAAETERREDYLRQGFWRAGMHWRSYEFEVKP